MRTRHLVDTALFDIAFSDEETAFQAQTELETLIKRQLLQVVDEVFDQRSRSGFVLRIPKLEIDLGNVAYDEYQEELPRRLRERLSAILTDISLPMSGASSSPTQIFDDAHAEYLQLEHFLLFGNLPWYGSQDDEVDWTGILERVLRDNGLRLKNFLQATPHRRQVTTRLVNQFALRSMVRLFGLLAPAHAEAVGQLMVQLILTWREHPVILNALGLNPDAAERQLWFFLLEIVLGHDGHQYSAPELLVKALRRMLMETYQIGRKVLESFIEQSRQTHPGQPLHVSELLQQMMRQQLVPSQAQSDSKDQSSSGGRTPDGANGEQTSLQDQERLASILSRAIETADLATIEALWQRILSGQGALFQHLLRRYGQDARVRKRFAYGFSEARLHSILEMIEPLEHRFVTGVIEQPELFGSQDISGDRGGERTRRQLWEFSLDYLLVERGSRFNKKVYLASLLRQMASSVNLHFVEMLDVLLENLNKQIGNKALSNQMRQLLMELRNEQRPAVSENARTHPSPLRGYAHYDRLTRALTRGVNPIEGGENGLIEVIGELRQVYPWLLQRVFREMQAAARNSTSFQSADLPAALSEPLVLAFIELMIPAGSDLRDSVEHYAQRAQDKRRYYRRLLTCLIKDELLDFELLAGETPMAADVTLVTAQQDPLRITKSAQADERASVDDDLLPQSISRYLQGDVVLSAQAAAELVNAIARQLQYRSKSLLAHLMSALSIPSQLERLVGLLPEPLLARLALELAGQAAQRMLQASELITLACPSAPRDGAGRALNRIKWSFILGYLHKTGGLIEHRRFARLYVTHLTERLQQDEPQQFRDRLVQRLLEHRLPSTRELSLRLNAWLKQAPEAVEEMPVESASTSIATGSNRVQQHSPQQEVNIGNAGLVLAAPYLPRLFGMLELMEESAFRSTEAALRAVHLVQYLVDENPACPEHRLFLNKLLCGVKTDEPLPREIEPSDREQQILYGLLQGMIDNWKALGNTSVAGLREAFLQREGRLQMMNESWHLQVEAKAYDMLLDQLPWSFAIIKHPWMKRVIHVEWR